MFYLRQVRKAGIFIALAIFFTLGVAFAETAEETFNKGKEALIADDYDKAIGEFTKAIEMNPKDTRAYNNRGLAYSHKGSYDQAISDFTKTIEIKPDDFYAPVLRSQAYYKKGSYDQAIADCNKIIERDPHLGGAYYTRAQCFYMKGDYDKAWADVHKTQEKLFKVEPDFLNKLKKASGREK